MLKISGASDDIVCLDGHGIDDEVDCYDRNVLITVGWPEAAEGRDSQGLYVLMRYAPSWHPEGVWTAEVAPLDEDVEIPWPVTVTLGGRGYSAEVEIDLPEGVPVTWKKIQNK